MADRESVFVLLLFAGSSLHYAVHSDLRVIYAHYSYLLFLFPRASLYSQPSLPC